MIKLTDADRALIANIVDETSTESIYRAGIAAGIERAAQICEGIRTPESLRCAAAIRALLK